MEVGVPVTTPQKTPSPKRPNIFDIGVPELFSESPLEYFSPSTAVTPKLSPQYREQAGLKQPELPFIEPPQKETPRVITVMPPRLRAPSEGSPISRFTPPAMEEIAGALPGKRRYRRDIQKKIPKRIDFSQPEPKSPILPSPVTRYTPPVLEEITDAPLGQLGRKRYKKNIPRKVPRRIDFTQLEPKSPIMPSPVSRYAAQEMAEEMPPQVVGKRYRKNIQRTIPRRIDFSAADPEDPVTQILNKVQTGRLPSLPATDASELFGMAASLEYQRYHTLLDSNVPRELESPIKPPTVIHGWSTPEHLKEKPKAPPCYEFELRTPRKKFEKPRPCTPQSLPATPRIPTPRTTIPAAQISPIRTPTLRTPLPTGLRAVGLFEDSFAPAGAISPYTSPQPSSAPQYAQWTSPKLDKFDATAEYEKCQ